MEMRCHFRSAQGGGRQNWGTVCECVCWALPPTSFTQLQHWSSLRYGQALSDTAATCYTTEVYSCHPVAKCVEGFAIMDYNRTIFYAPFSFFTGKVLCTRRHNAAIHCNYESKRHKGDLKRWAQWNSRGEEKEGLWQRRWGGIPCSSFSGCQLRHFITAHPTVSPPWWIDGGTLALVRPTECNHIQQEHASNRPEIDPEGEEVEVVNVGPLGTVRASRPSVSPSHRQTQQGSAWV